MHSSGSRAIPSRQSHKMILFSGTRLLFISEPAVDGESVLVQGCHGPSSLADRLALPVNLPELVLVDFAQPLGDPFEFFHKSLPCLVADAGLGGLLLVAGA